MFLICDKLAFLLRYLDPCREEADQQQPKGESVHKILAVLAHCSGVKFVCKDGHDQPVQAVLLVTPGRMAACLIAAVLNLCRS
ncbi:hypothetical protein CF68_24965 [Cupriavidus sp. SK-4]|nr:hypothetical protein CF68_24965 [Cupriavidus sp. SK-4]